MIVLNSFTGCFPATPDQLLPDNAAQYAKDCDVRYGELKPIAGSVALAWGIPANSKGVFTTDGAHVLASQTPLYAYLSPVVDDKFDRIYFTNGNGLRACKRADLSLSGTMPTTWNVGVPIPTSALTIRKTRKNRWPNYPNTALKAKVFFESDGVREYEESVTPTLKAGCIPFSTYTLTTSQDVKKASANSGTTLYAGGTANIVSITLSSEWYDPMSKTHFPAGTTRFSAVRLFRTTSDMVAAGYCVIDEVTSFNGFETISYPAAMLPLSIVSSVTLASGATVNVSTFTSSTITSSGTGSTVSSGATLGIELWLENTDNSGERIWTTSATTSSSGIINSIPGGADVSIKSTGTQSYEVNLSFGTIEDRAYVYTMVNDWNEESMPSDPATTSVTYVDDVVLQVDYDDCAKLLADGGFRSLNHLNFYRATNGTYVKVNVAPATATDITSLYTSLLGRDPDSEGLAYWTAQYNSGMSMSDIASKFVQSQEYMNTTWYLAVEDLYYLLLNRAPETSGFKYWYHEFERGQSLRDIANGFLISDEFKSLHPVMPSVNWFYQITVGRDGDAPGVAHWYNEIATKGQIAYAQLVNDLMVSEEFKTYNAARHITGVLTSALGHTPSTAELNAAIAKYNSGYSINAVTASSSSITTDGWVEQSLIATSGATLPSLEWNPPPAQLGKLAQLPNGVFAGVVGNYLYFSEPYRPHAWPANYAQALPYECVSAMPFDGQLLITTKAAPLFVSGAHPASMTQQKLGSNEAGASEFGITVANGRPFYVAKEGLVIVEGLSGSLALSNNFFTAEKWREKYGSRVSNAVLIGYDSRLIALFETGDGFIINLSGQQPTMVEFSGGFGYPFRIPGEETLYLATASGCKKLFFGTGGGYTWHSKEFTLPKPSSYGVCRIVHDASVKVTFYGDKQYLCSTTIVASALTTSYLRLPSSSRYLRFSLKIESSGRVQEVNVANTMREVQNV